MRAGKPRDTVLKRSRPLPRAAQKHLGRVPPGLSEDPDRDVQYDELLTKTDGRWLRGVNIFVLMISCPLCKLIYKPRFIALLVSATCNSSRSRTCEPLFSIFLVELFRVARRGSV